MENSLWVTFVLKNLDLMICWKLDQRSQINLCKKLKENWENITEYSHQVRVMSYSIMSFRTTCTKSGVISALRDSPCLAFMHDSTSVSEAGENNAESGVKQYKPTVMTQITTSICNAPKLKQGKGNLAVCNRPIAQWRRPRFVEIQIGWASEHSSA